MRHNEMRVGDITYAETEEWVCDFSVTQKSMAGGLFLTNPFPLCLTNGIQKPRIVLNGVNDIS